MTGNKNAWRAPLAGLASLAMIATMGVAAGTANAAAPKVKFDVQGHGTAPTEQTMSGNQLVNFASATPSATGWVFTGWYTEPGLGDGVRFNPAVPVVADTTLYAHWAKKADVVTVSYDKPGALSFADVNQDGTVDGAKDRKVELAAGDKLAEWMKPTDGDPTDGKLVKGIKNGDADADYTAAVDVSVKLTVDTEASKYVKFVAGTNTDLADAATTIEIPEDGTFNLPVARITGGSKKAVEQWVYNPNAPTAESHRTAVWDNADNTVPEKADGLVLTATDQDDAEVEDTTTVKVSFELKDPAGSPTTKSFYVADGSPAPEYEPDLLGGAYEFDGWTWTVDGKELPYNGEALDQAAASEVTLKGLLKLANVQQTVTFDPNYTGSTVTTVQVANGAAVAKPTDPAKAGYVFQGWQVTSPAPAGTTLYVTDKDFSGLKATSDLTLTALWLTDAQDQLKQLLDYAVTVKNANVYDQDAQATKDYLDKADEAAKAVRLTYDANSATVTANPVDKVTKLANAKAATVKTYVDALTALKAKLVPVNSKYFNDVNVLGSNVTPHAADIEFLAKKNIIGGFADGTFRPLSTMKRQDFAAFLYRLAGSPEYTPAAADDIFSDVDASTPHYKEILWASSKGIVKGFADGTFRGMSLVNRQDAAAFFYRLAGSPEFDASKAAKQFADVDPAGTANHEKEVLWAANTVVSIDYDEDGFDASDYAGSIVQGFPNNTFAGTATLLRQDGAAFIARMYAYLNK